MQYIQNAKILAHDEQMASWPLAKHEITPVTVEIQPTLRCQLRCVYCEYRDRLGRREMDRDTFAAIHDALEAHGVKGIIYSGGGEPLLHPVFQTDLPWRSHGSGHPRYGLITNGIALSGRVMEQAVDYATWIRISLDTVSPSLYRALKRAGTPDTPYANLRAACAYKAETGSDATIGAQILLWKDTLDTADATLDALLALPVDYVQVRPRDYYDYDPGEMRSCQAWIESVRKQEPRIMPTKWECVQYRPRQCHAIWWTGAIGVDAQWYLCCHHIYHKQYCYGPVLGRSWDAMLKARAECARTLNLADCPPACRGVTINSVIERARDNPHKDFL